MDDSFGMGYALGVDASNSGGSGGGSNGGNGGMFNGDAFWGIILLALLFGGRGFGGGFGGGESSGGGGGNCCCGVATQADLAAGFNNSAVLSNLNDLQLGQAGIQQTLCQGFNGVNTALLTGFNGIERGFGSLSAQLAKCCCDIERGIDGVNYNMATNFCNLGNTIQSGLRDVIDNQNANYRGIMDFMVQSKMDALRSENENLRLRASQADQNAVIRAAIDASTAEIIRRTGNDYPTAAYLVNAPTPVNFPTNCCGTVQFGGNYGGNSGCGCGCGCGC